MNVPSLKDVGENLKAYAVIWGVMGAASLWVVSVNQGIRHQSEILESLKRQDAVQDDVLVRVNKIQAFQRDSLTTTADLYFLWNQSQRQHRTMWRAIEKAGGGRGYQDRPPLYQGYGPTPDKFQLWFDPAPTDWLEAKAGGQ